MIWHQISCVCLTLMLGTVAIPTADAAEFNSPPDPVPASLAAGDVLNLGVGAATPLDFMADAGSIIHVNGGTVQTFTILHADANVNSGLFQPFQVTGVVNVYGGTTGGSMAFRTELNVFGGTVEGLSILSAGAVLNLYDGAVGGSMTINNAEVNIFGGTMDAPFTPFNALINMYGGTFVGAALFGNSEFNIYGGTLVDPNLQINDSSEMKIYGSSFLLDGAPIPGLTFGTPIEIAARDVVLTGTLLDGNSIIANIAGPPFGVDTTAVVTVYLVPEPTAITLLLCGISAVGMRIRRLG